MIRTLTLVSLLALFAGGALGFFVAEVRASGPTASPSAIDPRLEERVQEYVTSYRLSASDTEEIRAAIRDLQRSVIDRLHRFRAEHAQEFRDLHARAQSRIDAVIAKSGQSGR